MTLREKLHMKLRKLGNRWRWPFVTRARFEQNQANYEAELKAVGQSADGYLALLNAGDFGELRRQLEETHEKLIDATNTYMINRTELLGLKVRMEKATNYIGSLEKANTKLQEEMKIMRNKIKEQADMIEFDRRPYQDFDAWWQAFLLVAENHNVPVNLEDRDSYRDFFEDGDTPREAVDNEIAAMA